jgi:hypothetical protein
LLRLSGAGKLAGTAAATISERAQCMPASSKQNRPR